MIAPPMYCFHKCKMNNQNIMLQTVQNTKCDGTNISSECDMKDKDELEENRNDNMTMIKEKPENIQIEQNEVRYTHNLHTD